MNLWHRIYDWATGGDYHYQTLGQSLNGDVWLAYTLVSLCTGIGVGYVIIALRWRKEARSLSPSDAKNAMNSLMSIFLICAISGYFWPLIKMQFPVWRLQAVMLFALLCHTWRFVFHPSWLKDVTSHLNERDKLILRNDAILAEIDKLKSLIGGGNDGKRLEPL